MKKYKKLAIGLFMATVITLIPVASFAEGTGNNNNHSNSIWNRIFNLFNHANAEEDNNQNLTPNISGIKAPTTLAVGEVGTWTIKAHDPQNGTLEYAVDWGDDNSLSQARMMQSFSVQTGTFTHSYANTGKYKIIFTISNDAGLKTTSTVTVNVGNTETTTPVISNLTATSKNPHNATVSWKTNLKTNSLVWYSKTSPVDTSAAPKISRKAKIINHKIVLNKLEANTRYYVIVKSGTAISAEASFVTKDTVGDNVNPVITSLTGPRTIKVGEIETVTVKAHDPQNGTLNYTVDWGDVNSTARLFAANEQNTVQSSTFSHVYSSEGTYTATFTVEDNDGHKDSASMKIVVTKTSVDETNPVISAVRVSTGSSISTISWKTDEQTKSQIFYSTNTNVDTNNSSTLSVVDNLFETTHSLNINGLASNTIYHFVIKSVDASNNTTISGEYAFITN